jgi:hypothetical protein
VAGFRFSFLTAKDGSPFKCEECSERDREARNCFNHRGLTENARAVTAYTTEVTDEHGEKGAKKVFRLGEIRLYECPVSYITADTAELMRLCYLLEGSGALLHPGGWGAQPPWLIEAYEIYKFESVKEIEGRRNDRS